MRGVRVHVLVGEPVGVESIILGLSGLNGLSLLILRRYGSAQLRESLHFFIEGWAPVLEQIILHEFFLLALGPVEVAEPGYNSQKSSFTRE